MSKRIKTTRQAAECRAAARERMLRRFVLGEFTDAFRRASSSAARAQAWLDKRDDMRAEQ